MAELRGSIDPHMAADKWFRDGERVVDSATAAGVVKLFLTAGTGQNSLRVWLAHFDRNCDERIDYDEFRKGMEELNFPGDVFILWAKIDSDSSGYIDLNEIDPEASEIWLKFRKWASDVYTGSKDMYKSLGGTEMRPIRVEKFIPAVEETGGYTGTKIWCFMHCKKIQMDCASTALCFLRRS
jgi:hypothetical protein